MISTVKALFVSCFTFLFGASCVYANELAHSLDDPLVLIWWVLPLILPTTSDLRYLNPGGCAEFRLMENQIIQSSHENHQKIIQEMGPLSSRCSCASLPRGAHYWRQEVVVVIILSFKLPLYA